MTGQGGAPRRRACPAGQALDFARPGGRPYAPHVHEEYAVGACTAGREVIRYRGALHYAGPGSVVVLEPGEAHTGGPADPPDFTYRVMYPAAGLLAEGLLAEGLSRAGLGWPRGRAGCRGSASRSSPIPGWRRSCACCTRRWAPGWARRAAGGRIAAVLAVRGAGPAARLAVPRRRGTRSGPGGPAGDGAAKPTGW